MAGGLDAEPRLGGDARQSPRAFQRLRDPRGEGLRQWAGGDPGTERPGHRAREPGRQRLSDISGLWLPWEVSRDCEEESPTVLGRGGAQSRLKDALISGLCGSDLLPCVDPSPFGSHTMNTSPGTVGSDPVILATAGYDHTVRFWQAHSGICTRTVQHQDSTQQVNALEITPDRTMIAAAGYQHIRMYDLNSNNPNPIISYDGVNKNIASVGFHEDGRWMYTGGEDCTARIWDLRSRNLQCQRIFQVNAPINCVCLHPNQAELIVGDQSGAIHIWDLKTDHNEQLIPEPEVSITSAHIDPDASYMAAVNSTGNCYVWNLTGGIGDEVTQLIPKTKIPAHTRYALQCRFSPDSTLLATCSADQTCKIWRTSNFSLMTELSIKSSNPGESSRGWMWGCAFSGDSQYIVTASSDNLARLWCVETGEIKREYGGHQKAVVCLAFNDSVLG
ncbi:MLST8 [Cervus elaphus hippelaphus]|uniref:Target of rapamycin complex subunit LST8 n=5 Tax=Boreoeutheria TaxID=1437010 RepID=A0A212D0D2_CEREH|nr:MLST8 [Cervus elaphus hippelaphus]